MVRSNGALKADKYLTCHSCHRLYPVVRVVFKSCNRKSRNTLIQIQLYLMFSSKCTLLSTHFNPNIIILQYITLVRPTGCCLASFFLIHKPPESLYKYTPKHLKCKVIDCLISKLIYEIQSHNNNNRICPLVSLRHYGRKYVESPVFSFSKRGWHKIEASASQT